MTRSHCFGLLLVASTLLSTQPAFAQQVDSTKPVQVFILLGQSNMVGLGKISGDESSLEHVVKVKKKYPYLLNEAGEWSQRDDVRYVRVMDGRGGGTQQFNNEPLTVKTCKTIGPEFGIAQPLGNAVDAPVMLLKSCIGNRSLGWDLLPPGSERYEFTTKDKQGNEKRLVYAGYKDRPESWELDPAKGTSTEPGPWLDKEGKSIDWYAGKQYDSDIAKAKQVLAELDTYYPGANGYEVAGFFFWQGEKDCGNPGHASRYEQNLVHFIKQLRTEFNAPNAKFVLATLGESTKGSGGNAGLVLEAQLAVDGSSGKYPEFEGNVATIYTNPIAQGGSGNGHYGGKAEVYMDVGEAMGQAMVELLSKRGRGSLKSARVKGERIIDRTTAAWQSQQIQEPCILENPKDPSRLIMFYSGVPAADRGTCFVGKAWALKSEPFVWHQDPANPVFKPAATGWDSRSLRLDCVLYLPEEDAYYIYYSATDKSDAQDRIGLAICPAGADGYSDVTPEKIQRYGTAPVLAPEAAEPFMETMASQAAVFRERDASGQWLWYLYYSYRGRNGTLPGIRLATSRDGKSWERKFNTEDPGGKGHLFESTPNAYYEWHQVFKVDDTYVLSIEVGPERGVRWRPVLAVSRHPDKGWEQLDLDAAVQTRWSGAYSDETIFHVATPAFYRFDDRWYLYTQACPLPANRNYIDGKWDLWCFECQAKLPTRPGLAELFIPGAK